ncbi:MAG: pseudouridine synthase [Bacteroidota bacterium]
MTRHSTKPQPRTEKVMVNAAAPLWRTLANEIRLNRYLSLAGVASRRKADELIASGAVLVNGEVVRKVGTKVNVQSDVVTVHGKHLKIQPGGVYIVINKPKDCITTTSDESAYGRRRTVLDLVHVPARVFPVGRLDRNTTGALLLTNDGDLAYRLMHPKYQIPRAYKVLLDRPLTEAERSQLVRGLEIEPGVRASCALFPSQNDPHEYGVVLREGRYHEVRLLFEKLGRVVKRLSRVAYANITTEGLKRGEWRYLTPQEVAELKAMVNIPLRTSASERKLRRS